jgi:hypothetical protein
MDDRTTQFSQAWFRSALDTAFTVDPGKNAEGPLSLRLTAVNERSASGPFEQFSVLFLGPPSPVAPQGTHRFVHETLGEFQLFMTPVGRTSAGTEYEICLSREVPAGS